MKLQSESDTFIPWFTIFAARNLSGSKRMKLK